MVSGICTVYFSVPNLSLSPSQCLARSYKQSTTSMTSCEYSTANTCLMVTLTVAYHRGHILLMTSCKMTRVQVEYGHHHSLNSQLTNSRRINPLKNIRNGTIVTRTSRSEKRGPEVRDAKVDF